ncbi:MAG: MATE family efflux transporter [Puniceicoccaceae bacterium]
MSRSRYFTELSKTLVLAFPIAAGHVSQMLLGLADTLMIGRVGVVPLAASAFAHSLFHIVFIVGVGLLTAVAVLVAHAHGAGDKQVVGEMLRRGLAISVVGGIGMLLLLLSLFPLLDRIGQPPEVIAVTKPYLFLLSLGLPFLMAIICFRNYSEAQNIPWIAFWAGLIAVILNIFLNWILIYGNLGAPALGLNGAGIATLIARVFNLVLLVVWLRMDKRFSGCWPVVWWKKIPWRNIMEMLRLGFPVGMQLLMEVGAFSFAILLMGWLGVVELAAHQIAITCAATTFMFPLGLSIAVSIRVGHVIGAGEPVLARTVGFGGIGFAVFLSGIFTYVFIVFNRQLAGLFTTDPETVTMAASLLVVAGIFQFFDGTQALGAGALRGCKDVTIPTGIIFAAYWLLAMPLGAYLAFLTPMAAVGIWIGLAVGLGFAAIGLVGRFMLISRRVISH